MPRGEAGDRAPGAAAAQGHGSQVRLVAEESVAVPHASHLRMQNDTTESTAACGNPGVRISFVKAKKKKKSHTQESKCLCNRGRGKNSPTGTVLFSLPQRCHPPHPRGLQAKSAQQSIPFVGAHLPDCDLCLENL